jgi:hypothetical protein
MLFMQPVAIKASASVKIAAFISVNQPLLLLLLLLSWFLSSHVVFFEYKSIGPLKKELNPGGGGDMNATT